VQASVGSHCLSCARAARPDLRTRARYAWARQLSPVTTALIIINVAVFAWISLGGGDAFVWGDNARSVDLAVSKAQLGGEITIQGQTARVFEQGEWYRILTSGFVHFGIVHLLMNMFSLYQLGGILERKLGSVRFTLLYFAGLLGGSAGVVLIQPNGGPTAGASGAIFGLLAAMAISLWQQGVSLLNSSIGQVLVLNLFITFAGRSFISVGGHLGGAIAGALCGLVMLGKPWRPSPTWATYITPIGVGLAATTATVIAVVA
jgi:membrane associated rhomboid family serine protease